MAKKSRRVKRKGQQVRLSPTQMVQPGADKVADIPSSTAARSAARMPDLGEEYRYVITDLKRNRRAGAFVRQGSAQTPGKATGEASVPTRPIPMTPPNGAPVLATDSESAGITRY